MEAHLARAAVLVAAISSLSLGASYRTANFVVEAPTPQLAQEIGDTAERFRRDLAIEWLGTEMPNWGQPCPLTAQVADHLGAGGATSFVFDHGEVFGWRMTIQGSRVRILDSVLPHEVTHTIFATHFRRPLPRWADEGACTIVEHTSERSKQQKLLIDFLRTGHGIAFNRMFAMKEYPHDVLPLYSQGYSVARYLVAQGGKHKFLEYLGDGMQDENWNRATQQHYGISDLAALQHQWLDWVKQGSPAINAPSAPLVAVKSPGPTPARVRPATNLIHRDAMPTVADPAEADAGSVYDLASRPAKRAGSSSAEAPRPSPGPAAATAVANVDSEVIEDLAREARLDADSPAAYQVTRQQDIQRPQQVILEWSKPRGQLGQRDTGAKRAMYPGPAGE